MTLAVAIAVILIAAYFAGYLWQTWEDQPEPHQGRHRLAPIPLNLGQHPYPPLTERTLSVFPGEDNPPIAMIPSPRLERLATTGELRALAYAGKVDEIAADTAQWQALNNLQRWTAR